MLTHMSIICQFNIAYTAYFIDNSVSKEDLLFFDIETTGLSHKNSRVYLIGAIGFWEKEYRLIQYLAENDSPEEEKAVLEAFSSLCKTRSCLIHYNGSTFDIPYLLHKHREYHLPSSLPSMASVDLYRHLLPYKALFKVPDFRQKSLEHLSGYERTDVLSGRELIGIFHTYSQTGAKELESLLLLHNKEDLLGMCRILPLGCLRKLFEGFFTIRSLSKTTARHLDGSESLELLFSLDFDSALSFLYPISLTITEGVYLRIEGTQLKIKITVYEGTLHHFYADYKNYFYLPAEDEAIHKSVGIYVDAAYRKKAKASNCYKNITGMFLPLVTPNGFDMLKMNFEDKTGYLLFTKDFESDIQLQTNYLTSLLTGAVKIPVLVQPTSLPL